MSVLRKSVRQLLLTVLVSCLIVVNADTETTKPYDVETGPAKGSRRSDIKSSDSSDYSDSGSDMKKEKVVEQIARTPKASDDENDDEERINSSGGGGDDVFDLASTRGIAEEDIEEHQKRPIYKPENSGSGELRRQRRHAVYGVPRYV